MFLGSESKLCEYRANVFFSADNTTPTCLVLHTHNYYPYDFVSENVGT